MPFHFAFRPYRLPLRGTLRTAHELWTERRGVIVRIADPAGRVGFGEIAPMPAFGTETIEEAEAACRAVGEWPEEAQLREPATASAGLRNAIRCALADREAEKGPVPVAAGRASTRAVAALLPAGRPGLARMRAAAEAGFRTFKWKVGVADAREETGWLDELCAHLPGGGRLRLDANGAWERRTAERWLERCAERPIECVEQPCFASRQHGRAEAERVDDLLLGLAHDYPTPLALDESLVDEGDVARWVARGWPGWFVVKPTLMADLAAGLAQLSAARATVVFSSALETAVGAKAALRAAFAWPGEPKALGFGVWPLFVDSRCDGPPSAPSWRAEDVGRIDPETVWNALS